MSGKYIDTNTYATSGYALSGANDAITIGPKGKVGGTGLLGGITDAYTIVNHGEITATGTATGVTLQDGGIVANSTGAVISGHHGLYIEGGSGTVINVGTITGSAGGYTGFRLGTVRAYDLKLEGPGQITNKSGGEIGGNGPISGAVYLQSGTITNAGTIKATGSGSIGVVLESGAIANIGTSALIAGSRYGIEFRGGGAATLVNSGTIIAVPPNDYTQGAGIITYRPGIVDIVNQANGFIGGIDINGTVAIRNFGAMAGVAAVGSGTITNGSSGVMIGYRGLDALGNIKITNIGTIEGTKTSPGGNDPALSLRGEIIGVTSTLTDAFLTNASGALIVAYDNAIGSYHGTTQNSGVVRSTGSNDIVVDLRQDSSFTNGASGTITGGRGGVGLYASQGYAFSGTLINNGKIIGGIPDPKVYKNASGVTAYGDGVVINNASALIRGANGVSIGKGSKVTNAGIVDGSTGYGVYMAKGGFFDNFARGVIEGVIGAGLDMLATGPATLINFGTIASSAGAIGTAVRIGHLGASLVDVAGSTFIGTVIGCGGTLVLTGAGGSLSGIGSSFAGFGTVEFAGGASWSLGGSNTVAAGTTVTVLGTLADTGSATLSSGHIVILPTGMFDITGNVGVFTEGGSSFINEGRFEKTGGTGLSTIMPIASNSGTIAVDAGTLAFGQALAGTGTDAIVATGALQFDGSVSAGQTVAFVGTGNALLLSDPSGDGLGFAGEITDFGNQDRLVLTSFTGTKATLGWSQNGSTGTLTVTDGGESASITLFGQYALAGFQAATDSTGTVITYSAPTQLAALATPHR